MYQITCATTPVEPSSLSIQQPRFGSLKLRQICPSTTAGKPSLSRSTQLGLQTPPADEMSGTYPTFHYSKDFSVPTSSNYTPENAAAVSCYTNPSISTRPYTDLNLPPLQHLPPLQIATYSQPHNLSTSQPWQPYSSQLDVAPITNQSSDPEEYNQKCQWTTVNPTAVPTTDEDSTPICSTLPIPRSISENGGSLSDFAAQITCLFWFESIEVLNEAEGGMPPSMIKCLRLEAVPTSAFRKWTATIFSTTQVTDKVIILALLFIYRLKKYNSSVKGRNGSEYRLLTVALMLGNKFLDDNTYTNSTWAEVSGIAAQEIHIMEVEFLSNMRYSLLASKEQWEEWHTKLRNFKYYCDIASRAPPIHRSLYPPMPSPPESIYTSSSPNLSHYAQISPQNTVQWATSSSMSSSLNTLPSLPPLSQLQQYAHKRSSELEPDGLVVAEKYGFFHLNFPEYIPCGLGEGENHVDPRCIYRRRRLLRKHNKLAPKALHSEDPRNLHRRR